MKEGSVYANVGRGSTTDEEELIRFLKSGHLPTHLKLSFVLHPEDIESGISPEKWNGRFKNMVFSVNFDKMTYAVGYISND